MGIIKKIKLRVGEYILAKEFLFKKREKSVVNFADANYVGIVFNASNPENFELVKKYIGYLNTLTNLKFGSLHPKKHSTSRFTYQK